MDNQEDKTFAQIAKEIDEFLDFANGYAFTDKQIDDLYKIFTRAGKRYRWQILERKVKKGELQKLGTGRYRQVDDAITEIDWQDADVEDYVKLEWFLELEKYIKVYHKSVNVIAGEPGSGRTGLIYNLAIRNMHHPMGVVIFTNDMTPEEIKERMDNSKMPIPNPPPFKIYERADTFADVIEPDKINLIDYLDMNSEVYMIGKEIDDIYKKLNRGIAVVAIQKRPGQDIGIGGVFTWKRPKLYISLGTARDGKIVYHKLKIVKCRGRADRKVNPNGMEFDFWFGGGINCMLRET